MSDAERGVEPSNVNGEREKEEADFMKEITESLSKDYQNITTEETHLSTTEPKKKETQCCICGSPSIYTCPGCLRKTCGIPCIRVHKKDFDCSGSASVTNKLTLNEFSDLQIARDFHFLEKCRNSIENAERHLPRIWRYSFKALPPPLYALRDAAKKRGVICQITSEGMSKRDKNTSRFDRRTNTLVWRCEFTFHTFDPEIKRVVPTDWGNERHLLGDIMKYCWATNPPLPCFHINKKYNKASTYVEGSSEGTTEDHAGDNSTLDETKEEDADQKTEEITTHSPVKAVSSENPEEESVPNVSTAAVEIEPLNETEAKDKDFIDSFLHSTTETLILSKASRLQETKYFLLRSDKTLNENLRLVFFVNEYPEFEVIRREDLHRFPIVNDADKELIRTSFRAKPKVRREKPKKSDLTPEEVERLAKLPCRMFLAGKCNDTEECPFWHCSLDEVPVCRSFLKIGQCPKGERCSFRHDEEAIQQARKRQRETPLRERGRGRGRGRGNGM